MLRDQKHWNLRNVVFRHHKSRYFVFVPFLGLRWSFSTTRTWIYGSSSTIPEMQQSYIIGIYYNANPRCINCSFWKLCWGTLQIVEIWFLNGPHLDTLLGLTGRPHDASWCQGASRASRIAVHRRSGTGRTSKGQETSRIHWPISLRCLM